MEKTEQDYYLDVDGAIKWHNERNPDDKLNREKLANELEVTYMTIANYQSGRIPNVIRVIVAIAERTGYPIREIIKTKEDGRKS